MPEPRQADKLAPDPATLERAYALAKPRKWSRLGTADGQYWGVIPSRGARAYRALTDPAGRLYYCNCAAPRIPCKHVLALLILHVEQPQSLADTQRPDWLADWRQRARRGSSPEEEARAAAAREQQKARNRDQRLARMEAGAAELLQWLGDLLRLGLARAATLPPDHWEGLAARLVDAKLGGIARRVRTWPDLLAGSDGEDALLEELGSVYLLARGLRRLERLPEPLRHTALTLAGLPQRKDDVRQRPPQRDTWLVAGLELGEDQTLFYRRLWLWGERSRRAALLLDFAHGGPDFEGNWKVGMAIEGDVHYYAGARARRALLGAHTRSPEPFELGEGTPDHRTMLEDYARGLGENPWLPPWPYWLDQVVPTGGPGQWGLADRAGQQVPLEVPERAGWQLLALSGGEPLRVFGCWNGRRFQALSVAAEARLIALETGVSPGSA